MPTTFTSNELHTIKTSAERIQGIVDKIQLDSRGEYIRVIEQDIYKSDIVRLFNFMVSAPNLVVRLIDQLPEQPNKIKFQPSNVEGNYKCLNQL